MCISARPGRPPFSGSAHTRIALSHWATSETEEPSASTTSCWEHPSVAAGCTERESPPLGLASLVREGFFFLREKRSCIEDRALPDAPQDGAAGMSQLPVRCAGPFVEEAAGFPVRQVSGDHSLRRERAHNAEQRHSPRAARASISAAGHDQRIPWPLSISTAFSTSQTQRA